MARWDYRLWLGRAIQALSERAELSALADVKTEQVSAQAQTWQIPTWSDDYPDLLTSVQLDAVSICLPHDLYAPVAIDAMEAGLHVLVEKPLATTLAEADAMIAAADKAQVQLMVAENVRYHQTYRQVAELMQGGSLGDIFMIRISREREMHDYLRQRPWFLEQTSPGIMVSGGIHDFELLRMLGGEIEHVYGLVGHKVLPEMTADDTSLTLAGLHSGAAALLVESFSLKTPEPGVYGTVHGSQGSLWFHGDQIRLYTADDDGRPELVETISGSVRDTFETEWLHFLDCLDNQAEPITSGRSQRKPLEAVLATYASFERGERVYLAEF